MQNHAGRVLIGLLLLILLPLLLIMFCPVPWASESLLTGTSGTSQTDTKDPTYIRMVYDHTWATADTFRHVICSADGTISDLVVKMATAPGSGNSQTFTLMKNSGDTSLECTINHPDTSCTDTLNSVSVSAGDLLIMKNTPISRPDITTTDISMMFDSSTSAQSIWITRSGHNAPTGAYFTPKGWDGLPNATEAYVQQIMPTAGTFKNLYTSCESTPSDSLFTWVLRKNGADTSLTCTFTGPETSCNDTSNSVSVSAGDSVSFKITTSYGGFLTRVGAAFEADTDGEFVLANNLQWSSTETYFPVDGGTWGDSNSTESTIQMLFQACTIKNIYAKMDVAPGTSNSVTLKLRKNGVDTAIECTISDTNTSCNMATDVTVADDDLLSGQWVEGGTVSGTPWIQVSFLAYIEPPASGGGPQVIIISKAKELIKQLFPLVYVWASMLQIVL